MLLVIRVYTLITETLRDTERYKGEISDKSYSTIQKLSSVTAYKGALKMYGKTKLKYMFVLV